MVYDASADSLLSSKVPRLGASGSDFLVGFATRELAKDFAAKWLMKSWGYFAALHHAVLASPLRRMRSSTHPSLSMAVRNLSMTMSLATPATALILSE